MTSFQTSHLLDGLHGEGQGAAHSHTGHQAGIVVGKEAAGHIAGDIQAGHGLVIVVQSLTLFVDGNALLRGQQRGTQPAAVEGRGADGAEEMCIRDRDKALDIIENAKASRPSVCNAEEVCLVHRDIAAEFLPKLARRLGPDRAAKGLHPVELRSDPCAAAIIPGTPAGPADFDTEFLDYILAIKIVDSVEEAIGHIAAHSTGHSEAILTQNEAHAALFTAAVDSAAVYVNCSTRFTDGGEFGLGCEMGISTQKLHARGPMGLEELCSYKYIIHGSGQIR